MVATPVPVIQNGLALIPDDEDGVVGIHDGVRPFVSKEVIEECFETARRRICSHPCICRNRHLRYIDQHGGGKNVLRSDYRVVQTPQTFDIGLAKQAFNQEYKEQFTDDASVVESLGCQVAMVEGNRENIKITTPFDIKIAEAFAGVKAKTTRHKNKQGDSSRSPLPFYNYNKPILNYHINLKCKSLFGSTNNISNSFPFRRVYTATAARNFNMPRCTRLRTL